MAKDGWIGVWAWMNGDGLGWEKADVVSSELLEVGTACERREVGLVDEKCVIL